MENHLSDVKYVQIPPYRMAKAQIISTNPEEEVISFLQNRLKTLGIDISQSRSFGFDVPVSEKEQAQGIRGYEFWMAVPDSFSPSDDVGIVDFPGGEYLSLRITDPFADPFTKIPDAWQHLVRHIKSNNIKADYCGLGGCLEEVIETDGKTYMDISIRVI